MALLENLDETVSKLFGRDFLLRHGLGNPIEDKIKVKVDLSLNEGHEYNQEHPHFLCGPSNIAQKKLNNQVLEMENEYHDHIAFVDHASDNSCLLVMVQQNQAQRLNESKEWSITKIPPLLKIHPSIFHLFPDVERSFRNENTTTNVPKDDTKRIKMEDLDKYSLVLNIYPAKPLHENTRLYKTIEDTLNKWTVANDREDNTHFIKNTEFMGGHWHKIRSRALSSATGRACVLPASSHIEYEGDFVRIVDLSGFSGEGAGCLARLVEVAAMDHRVLSVTIEDRPMLLNYAARGVLQSGTAGNEPFTLAGLTGENEIIGVADSGLNDMSCFFKDTSSVYTSDHVTRSTIYNPITEVKRRKVVQYIANADGGDDSQGHGTHVCGSIAGNSLDSTFTAGNGIVPDAKIAFFDLQVSGSSSVTIPDLYQYVYGTPYKAGARILSNSWGSSSSGGYTSRSYASDLFAYSKPDTLLVFAAGNSGAEDGDMSNFNPCISKNVLCVGSTNLRDDSYDSNSEELEISYFSSLGPTFDGRIKPDVVGPGFKIISALSGDSSTVDETCGVTEIQGTSMAAPLMAGAAAVARQYFSSKLWTKVCNVDYLYCLEFVPTGYLLKGLLIHSGRRVSRYSNSAFDDKTHIDSDELFNPPDFFQGYGQVTLTHVLPLSGHGMFDLFVHDTLMVESDKIYAFTVYVNAESPLKVTLVWYDVPSAVGSTSTLLINNLDLCVIDIHGRKWFGNDASSSGKVDVKNPQEQVLIPYAAPGVYTVYVSASTLYGDQGQAAAIIITSHGYVAKGPVEVPEVTGNYNGIAPIYEADILPNGANYDYEHLFSIQVSFGRTLRANTPTCLKSFTITSHEYVLSTIDMSLDAYKTSGTAAFLLSVLLTSPSGITVQIGGYYRWYTNDRIWSRTWPIHWTLNQGSSASESDYWVASRSVDVLNLQETGKWYLCLELLFSGWNTTFYTGDIAVTFRKNVSVPTVAPTTPMPTQQIKVDTNQAPQEQGSKAMFTVTEDLVVISGLFMFILVIFLFSMKKVRRFLFGQRAYGQAIDISNSGSSSIDYFSSNTDAISRAQQRQGTDQRPTSPTNNRSILNFGDSSSGGMVLLGPSTPVRGNWTNLMSSMNPVHWNRQQASQDIRL